MSVTAAAVFLIPTFFALPDPPRTGEAPLAERVAGANAFALDLYRASMAAPGNLVLSPFGLATTLAMCWAACDGESHAQIGAALHFRQSPDVVHAAMAELLAALRAADAESGEAMTLELRRRLFGSARESAGYYRESYLELVRRRYDAELELLDFLDPVAAERLERWFLETTAGAALPQLLPANLGAETVLVLADAAHFRGLWRVPFEVTATCERPFRLASGREELVATMAGRVSARRARVEGVELLELPYAGDRLRLLVLVPGGDRNLDELEARLDEKLLRDSVGLLEETTVDVELPRFRCTSAGDLAVAALPALGVHAPFTLRRDWAPLHGEAGPLRIAHVFHSASIEVEEEGTEAAAAAAVVKVKGPVDFAANRPFLFLLRDAQTGLILFAGRVVDPREGGSVRSFRPGHSGI